MMSRRLMAAYAGCAALSVAATSNAQSLHTLAESIQELASHLAEMTGDAGGDSYLLAKYGVLKIGSDVTKDVLDEKIKQLTLDGSVKNLRSHLETAFEDGKTAKRLVNGVSVGTVDAPDIGHPDYCDQIEESTKKLVQLEKSIEDLNKLVGVAAAYKQALAPMDKMKAAAEYTFATVMSIENIDVIVEETTYGSLAEQWQFFSAEADAGSAGDVNAAYLWSHAKDDWDYVEWNARAKAEQLRETLAFRKAYHEHFYAVAAKKCASSGGTHSNLRGATHSEAAGSGDGAVLPSNGGSQTTDCSLLKDTEASNALMERDQTQWLDLVGRCTGR
jgi:hypothetical protein